MKSILKFNRENLQELQFFIQGLEFPIVIACYDDWQQRQVQIMADSYEQVNHTSLSLCKWCLNHSIDYQILYPLTRKEILMNPIKYYYYKKFQQELDKHQKRNSDYINPNPF